MRVELELIFELGIKVELAPRSCRQGALNWNLVPFQNAGNRAFTLVSVSRNAPSASGVYGISNARQWLYVGATANIRAELLSHLEAPDEILRAHSPSGFTFELCEVGNRVERQNQLVFELEPIGNRMSAKHT